MHVVCMWQLHVSLNVVKCADIFTHLLTNEERLMVEEQFMTDMMSMTSELPSSLFDNLAHHLSICGVERKNCKLKELRRY